MAHGKTIAYDVNKKCEVKAHPMIKSQTGRWTRLITKADIFARNLIKKNK